MSDNIQIVEDSISTKDFILKVFNFFKLISKNWRLILIGLLAGTSISLVIDLMSKKKTNYRSTIIFNLELGGGGGNSQLGGLASAFGIMGNNNLSGGELFTSQNFPTIVLSRAVFERALMKNVEVDGDSLLMINYVMDSSDIKTNEWAGTLFRKPFSAAINYRFKEAKNPKDFTELENLIITGVYDKLKDLTTIDPLKTTNSIVVLSAVLTNEKLVKKWVDVVLESTEEFYIEMKTKKTREMLKIQEKKLNEIESQLNHTDIKIARLNYENPNVVDPMAQFKQTQVTRNSSFLTNQYITQLTNIEGLKRVLLEQTPIFTIMEETRLPLEKEYPSKGLSLKLISVAFLFITMLGIVLRDIYLEIMNS